MPLIDHPWGDYRFLPGIAPYLCGVVSNRLRGRPRHPPSPRSLRSGLRGHRGPTGGPGATEGRPFGDRTPLALALFLPGVRRVQRRICPVPGGMGLFVEGVNPVARTNVARRWTRPPSRSSTASRIRDLAIRPCCRPSSSPVPGNFPRASWRPRASSGPEIPRRGALPPRHSLSWTSMENRLRGLEADWPGVNAIGVYTIHPIATMLPEIILGRAGAAATHGVRWFYSRLPIVGIEYEMDLRGVRTELRLY